MRPILVALQDGQPRSQPEIRDTVATALQLTAEDRDALLPSGKQTAYANRIGWALTHMAKALLVTRPSRGHYTITDRGRQVLTTHPSQVDMAVLGTFPEYVEFRALRHEKDPPGAAAAVAEELSPSEAVSTVVAQADDAVAAELLERVLAQPPAFLERLALQLLQAMGYGGREALIEHTGKPGDAGLDGVVRQDALGLDLVGVQAKRYDKDAAVQRPEVQGFVGALQGAQTSRGVFVTTGRFSAGAKEFARSVGMRLILVDGHELTRLMVRYNVGVVVREVFELKQVDEEFFDQ